MRSIVSLLAATWLVLACTGQHRGPVRDGSAPPEGSTSPSAPPSVETGDPADSEGSRELRVGGCALAVTLDGPPPLSEQATLTWIRRAAQMVSEYYGGSFPVDALRVVVHGGGSGDIGFGSHYKGREVEIWAGRQTTARDMQRDWVLVHEMLHTGFPDLARSHRWMREGLSTYLESVVRARAGILTEDEVWTRWIESMPQGLPRAGDGGLEHTHTWGAVYWGGALYWLMVDVELRARTGNEQSIRDVVRAMVDAGGTARQRWSMTEVLERADTATGTTVASDVYDRIAARPGRIDLDALWRRLGVRKAGGAIDYDPSAPLAEVRRAMKARAAVQLAPLAGR